MSDERKAPTEAGANGETSLLAAKRILQESIPNGRDRIADVGPAHRAALERMASAWKANRNRDEEDRISSADWAVFSACMAMTASWTQITDYKAQRKQIATLANVSERTASRALGKLHRLGIITWKPNNRRGTSRLSLLQPGHLLRPGQMLRPGLYTENTYSREETTSSRESPESSAQSADSDQQQEPAHSLSTDENRETGQPGQMLSPDSCTSQEEARPDPHGAGGVYRETRAPGGGLQTWQRNDGQWVEPRAEA